MMFKIFVAVFVVAFCLAQLSDQMTVSSDRDVDEDKDWEKFKVCIDLFFKLKLMDNRHILILIILNG